MFAVCSNLLCCDDHNIGVDAVGNIRLRTIEKEMVALVLSGCSNSGKIGPCPRLGHSYGQDCFPADAFGKEALALLKPVLEDPSILKIGQNMKYDWKIFARHGIRIAPLDDTMLLSYAMHAGLNSHGMDALSEQYLGHQPIPIKSLLGSGKSQITFDRVGIDDAVKYAAGMTLNWGIGGLVDGKFTTAFARAAEG